MGRTSNLSKLSASALRRELDRRSNIGQRLLDRRAKLMESFKTALAVIDGNLADAGVEVSDSPATLTKRGNRKARKLAAKATKGAKRGRKPGSKAAVKTKSEGKLTLADAMESVMSTAKPMSFEEIEKAVKAETDYSSKSSNWKPNINQAIVKNPKRFKRVERGLYVRVANGKPAVRKTARKPKTGGDSTPAAETSTGSGNTPPAPQTTEPTVAPELATNIDNGDDAAAQ